MHSIEGTITSDDRTPLGGAVVHVYGPSGGFEIDNLGFGEYSLDVRAPGYNGLTGRTVGIRGHAPPQIVLALYDKVGYVLSLYRTTSGGEVNQTVFDIAAGVPARVGSAFDGSNLLTKLRYTFGRNDDAYVEASFRDQSQFRDLSAGSPCKARPSTFRLRGAFSIARRP